MATITALTESDTFRSWLGTTNNVIAILNTTTVRATINAIGAFAVSNTTDTTSSLTIYHATGGQTLANSTGLFISGNTTFSGQNFTANATSNVFTVSSNTTLLESLGGTTINSALVASKTLTLTGVGTFSANIDVTGTATFSANVSVANNLVASNTVYAKAVLFSETGAVVSDVISTASNDNYTATGLADASVLRINPDTRNIELTGLAAPTNLTTLASGGNGAKLLYLQNSGGTYKITLKHADTSSTAANRFVGPTNADVIVPTGSAVTLLYTVAEERWRVLAQVEPHVNRTQTVVSAATVTPNADADDIVTVSAQAEALAVANPSPAYTVVNGQKFILRIKDDDTARTITWGDEYRAIQSSLPSSTTASKTLYLGFIYNLADTKWDLVANAQEA